MLERYYGHVPHVIVEPGAKTGVPVLMDNPKEVGADRIANTLAAHDLYGGPCIVVDFGTSTNFDVVSAKGEFLGGALAPGVEISLDALAQRAAQLRKVEFVAPRSVIAKNTVEALQSGALYGFAGQVDGLVDRIIAELGEVTAVIATGGLAPIVMPESPSRSRTDPTSRCRACAWCSRRTRSSRRGRRRSGGVVLDQLHEPAVGIRGRHHPAAGMSCGSLSSMPAP